MYLMAAALLLATAGLTACGEKENGTTNDNTEQPTNPDPTPGDSNDTIREIENVGTHYAIYQMHGTELELIPAGDTLYYTATTADIEENDMVELQFKIENKQRESLLTYQELKQLDGMAGMAPTLIPSPQGVTICGNGTCPWNGQPYVIESGIYDKPIGLQLRPSYHAAGDWGLYRMVVGVGEDLENATIIYLHVTL